ncbi:hypothetical protein DENIS_1671 [Desulfonema ishimotonii]|uniref:N-(5'-phosphoribosyl)anthranilate isomerase n=1 Tax=Desulfonema ishimotonii TaxID=45657 RepID=A0A401FUU3_9BACT|nr:hypothetical protein [Desulfonema ishimotonii]GBC60714.1 hypothetical protein DENIS_1671 [Desulfonema ishimotonii]
MNGILVQIYEIQTRAEAERLVALGVDRIGSVLTSETDWKHPAIRETLDYVARTPARSSLIPLFNTPDAVFRALAYYRPYMVHFCETLADENGISGICGDLIKLQKSVKGKFPDIRIMRSIPIARPGKGNRVPSLELARMFEPVSDFFLTDTLILAESDKPSSEQQQPVSGFVGITGKTCDWDVAAALVRTSRIPVILAGGLGPENVADGIARTAPAGVDSCTETNAVDGNGRPIRFRKDMEKVRRFVAAARNCGGGVQGN